MKNNRMLISSIEEIDFSLAVILLLSISFVNLISYCFHFTVSIIRLRTYFFI